MDKIAVWMGKYQFAGYDLYHLVACFFLFSIIGWMVESTYISLCNKKFTNRGFMAGPFCPIYGVGATLGYIILRPFAHNIVILYIVGALLATAFEFFVAKLMVRLFGEFWWDYNGKFCNYKGMICLESTLAWGLYAVIIITFLFEKVISFIDRYPMAWGLKTIALVFAMVIIDFGYHFAIAVKIDEEMREGINEKKDELVDFCHRLIGR